MTVFFGNAELMKAVLVSSLLGVGTILSPATPLVINELRSKYWDNNMTTITAAVNLVNGILGMFFSGVLGRLSDKVGRKPVLVFLGVVGFSPVLSLLIVGPNQVGVMVNAVLLALSGITCITATGCPQCYALVAEVMPPEDREVGFGICFAALIFISGIANGAAYGLQALFHGEEARYYAVLIFTAVSDILYFVALKTVQIPTEARENPLEAVTDGISRRQSSREEHEDIPQEHQWPASVANQGLVDVELDDDDELESDDDESSSAVNEDGKCTGTDPPRLGEGIIGGLISPLKMMSGDKNIRCLCIISMLVSLPEVTLQDV
eukprot:CAMPEP_0197695676 /NCGR_PEP_ID=MMETSP1338-20131121/115515_1 /TAXON_ID=43686 ORGANISM="Pelagodinium beii, Strain RCC1491" /NCGR_SAMPLE_ID=MMETSP1338 /ASSEMBLY_ACC=CAM_ASM_000754 /LENGTH=321 /DNA_ID=CAMNT_0043278687 /DNA_START=69 /DNA_END=1031 /DNA_ORIENTATION=-